jgi:Uma2 family endonuclease
MTITVTNSLKLVIEIVSPGPENERRDRIIKRQAYSKFGVSEYWVIDRYQQTIEIYRLEQGPLMLTTLANNDQLTTPLLPAFSCGLDQLFEE